MGMGRDESLAGWMDNGKLKLAVSSQRGVNGLTNKPTTENVTINAISQRQSDKQWPRRVVDNAKQTWPTTNWSSGHSTWP